MPRGERGAVRGVRVARMPWAPRTLRAVGAAAGLLLVAGPAHAQADSVRGRGRVVEAGTLDAIVVTAARREQRLKDVVVETELIARDAIRQSGASDLAGVLTSAGGATLEGGVPAGAGVYLQGLGSQRVLVLLDGQPLTGRINGNFDLSRLPAAMVERVEVVKGPQSTLYGSDALGGVINVITRRPPSGGGGLRTTASLTGGSQGRWDAAVGAAGTAGAVGWVVDGGHRRTGLAPGIPGDAGTFARRWDFAPRLRWRVSPGVSLETGAFVVGERQRYRTGQLFNFADNTQLNVRAGATWVRGLWRFTPQLAVSRFDHLSRAGTAAEPASDSGARDVQQLVQADLLWSGIVGTWALDAGLTARREAITADRVAGGARTLHAVEPFAQLTLPLGAVTVTPGLRLSWNEQWGAAVTPRLAALWRPASGVAVRASAGRGYRAPDFKELYLQFVNAAAGYAVVGNPLLEPETSVNLALGAEWSGSGRYVRVSTFLNRYRDFIDTGAPDASGTYTYANIRRGSTRGVDAEIGRATARAQLSAGAGWLRARDAVTGAPLLGRPSWTARGSASLTHTPGWRASVLGSVSGRAPLALNQAGAVIRDRAPFARLDVRVTRLLFAGLETTAAVENVFDRRLGDSWPGFTGRSISVAIHWAPQSNAR